MNYITRYETRDCHESSHQVTFKVGPTKWRNVTIPYMSNHFAYLQIELEDQKHTDLLDQMFETVRVGISKGALTDSLFENIEDHLTRNPLETKGVAVSMAAGEKLKDTEYIIFRMIDYDPIDSIITIIPLLRVVD